MRKRAFISSCSTWTYFPELFSELESTLKLYMEANQETLKDRVVNSDKIGKDIIGDINYIGKPELRQDNKHQKSDATRFSKKQSLLDTQGCFNCNAPNHMAKISTIP